MVPFPAEPVSSRTAYVTYLCVRYGSSVRPPHVPFPHTGRLDVEQLTLPHKNNAYGQTFAIGYYCCDCGFFGPHLQLLPTLGRRRPQHFISVWLFQWTDTDSIRGVAVTHCTSHRTTHTHGYTTHTDLLLPTLRTPSMPHTLPTYTR